MHETREVTLKHPLPDDAGPFADDVNPGDSARLQRLRSIIDDELGWATPEDEERGDYEGRLHEAAIRLGKDFK